MKQGEEFVSGEHQADQIHGTESVSVQPQTQTFVLHCVQTLEENCALAANQSVDCRATILFTIHLNSSKV